MKTQRAKLTKKQPGNWLRMGLPALLAAIVVGTTARQAEAGTVSSLADSGPGSLREAIASAPPGDTISFSVAGTITLTSGELLVAKNLTIAGPGPGNLAVDGNHASRVFHIDSNTVVSISSLTITNGFFAGTDLPTDSGGGIYNHLAALTVTNCNIIGNVSSNSTGIPGSGQFSGTGGGVANDYGTLTVIDCTLRANVAGGGSGGGDYLGAGGGIYNNATATVSNSTLSDNSANEAGGGIFNANAGLISNATLRIANCTLIGNSAGTRGGGIFNSGFGGNATLTIANSTLIGNSASEGGGGIDNEAAMLQIANSTISSNSAGIYGGGIWNDVMFGGSATSIVLNCTFDGNSATGNTYIGGSGGSIANEVGGFGGSATVEIGSTILQAGASGGNLTNSSGTVTSLGYNLSSEGAGGLLTVTGDRINTDPMLGPLQNNGGLTLTHALLPGSPAIDQGKNFSASVNDQRGLGFSRTCDDPGVANASGGDGTDIGAYEVQVQCNQPPVARCRSVTVTAGADCVASASVDNGSFDPDGGPITLSQSPPGPYPLGTNVVTLTVADSHGASNSCTALVIVRDTTPPQLTCPANITVEFTSTNGAVVSFAPTASDTCSGPPVVVCAPASGSTFPIGTTPVLCTVTDLSGNSASCAFQVTVLGARGVKHNVLMELQALRTGDARGKHHDRHSLDDAIDFLADSLDARCWVGQTHLTQQGGGRSMAEEGTAVDELSELLRTRDGPASSGVLQGFINRIVKSDRLLALVAIQDAATGGVKPERISRAQADVAKGDAKAAEGRYAEAIRHYRDAWQEVQPPPVHDVGKE